MYRDYLKHRMNNARVHNTHDERRFILRLNVLYIMSRAKNLELSRRTVKHLSR